MEPVAVEEGHERPRVDRGLAQAGGAQRRGGNGRVQLDAPAPTFIRGVFPQNRGDAIPENEQLRIGMRARIEPGQTVPITVSWREQQEGAARVDYGTGSLPLPQAEAGAHS